MFFNNKKNKKISELEHKVENLENDINTLTDWLTDDALDNYNLRLKNSRIKLLNVLYLLRTKKECDTLVNCTESRRIEIEEKMSEQVQTVKTERKKYESDIHSLKQEIYSLKSDVVELSDEKLYQDFGLYTPVYNLMSSSTYKGKIQECRDKQKKMIKDKEAATCHTKWMVNNSLREGNKMSNRNIQQTIRGFNNECDYLIAKVKYNNICSIEQRIKKSFDTLNKLNEVNSVEISNEYFILKVEELHLCYEYEQKKQEEKEYARMIKEEEREQAKLLKEIEEERKKIAKEQEHYNTFLKHINEQIEIEADKERLQFLLEKRNDTEIILEDLDTALKDIDYREANQKAGYVYIISNIGAFGENIFKIGMTRRLNPQDRIDELGGASVPFKFDVHAMIFSDNAPALEASLHRAFDSKKVNMTNGRKEFFNVTLDEIKKVIIENYDKTVDFVEIPSAQQYRESLKIKESITRSC